MFTVMDRFSKHDYLPQLKSFDKVDPVLFKYLAAENTLNK
jgi:hypothetical protein